MYTIKNLKTLPDSEIELEIEISSEAIESRRTKALKRLNESIKLDGFRPGKVPESVLVSKVGEISILEEAAEIAISDFYPEIIKEKNIHPIGSPKIAITKIAKGSPVEITIRSAVFPTIELSDYKKASKEIMAKVEKIEVEEKEIEDVLSDLKKYRANIEHAKEHGKEGHVHDENETPKKVELTDDFVQTLGDFKNLAEFREKVKENLKTEKEYRAKEKKRLEVLKKIIDETPFTVPNVLVEHELDQMIHEFSHGLSRQGGTFEQYLKETKKSEDDVRNDLKEKAIDRVKKEIILLEIANKEKLKPEAESVMREVDEIKKQYPESPIERIQAFVEDSATKEEVFKFFEAQK